MELRSFARPLLAVSAVLVIALLVVACGGTASGAVSATPASPAAADGSSSATSVLIADNAFSPQSLSVKVGTTVTWTNNDAVPHDVVSTSDASTSASTTDVFNSGNLTQGQTFSYTFDTAGTFYYECTIHAAMASMHGTVVVQ